VISRALQLKLGAIVRETKPRGVPPGPRSAGSRAAAAVARVAAVHASAPHQAVAIQERLIVRTGIEEILPGGVLTSPQGSLFIHERLYTELGERPAPLLKKFAALSAPAPWPDDGVERAKRRHRSRARGTAGRAGALEPVRELPDVIAEVDSRERGLFRRFGHRRMLFLDIETCGLSAAPVFLVGLGMIVERNIVLRQLFARDYTEERALLHELGKLIRQFDFLVTFNGKSFDVPFLRDRAVHHRMRFPDEIPHLDLLWLARRRWKKDLPDCRLKTLEWRILRRRRAGDVSGDQIPGLYHDYVKRGEPHRLLPVFHHNLLDVVAMIELIPPLFDESVAPR
jgi:uncharacterized protein YprB with RNaseH-like and TPR domain